MSLDYLELEDLLIAAELFLGHAPEVRDYGLLESALARPRAVVFEQDAYPTLDDKRLRCFSPSSSTTHWSTGTSGSAGSASSRSTS